MPMNITGVSSSDFLKSSAFSTTSFSTASQVVVHLGKLTPALTGLVHEMPRGEVGDLLIEFSQSVAAGALVLTNEAHELLQLFVEDLETFVDPLLLLGRQRLVRLPRHRLALRSLGHHNQAGGSPHYREALRLGLLAEPAQLGLLLLAHLLRDGPLLLLVLLALEGLGDGSLKIRDQLLHVLAEGLRLAPGHAYGVRLGGFAEVVDVYPVVGSG